MFAQKLQTTLQVSVDRGTAALACKPGTKRKRNKHQVAVVKEEEVKLKQNRHEFLLEVQRLRAQVQQPGGIQLEHAANEIHELREQLGQERRNYMHQFQQMEQKVHNANSGSKNLQSKMKRLYEELNVRMDNKDGLDQLFGEVMNAEELVDDQVDLNEQNLEG